jgi:hypothetical protein
MKGGGGAKGRNISFWLGWECKGPITRASKTCVKCALR